MGFSPKHTKADRDMVNFNGLIIPNLGAFVVSGSIDTVTGSTTGSDSFKFDALAVRLRRVEVFHSGAASLFNVRLENATPNTGSFFDPRNIITCYNDIPGSIAYEGLDQIEDMIALTDTSPSTEGKIYLKVMPHGSGLNDFKYLLFFEAVMLYIDRDPKNTRVQ
jgi:hypothetical protein